MSLPTHAHSSAAIPRQDRVKAFTLLSGPTLVTLIPMAAAPALPAMAAHFGGIGGKDASFFAQLVMTLPAVMMICSAPVTGLFVERHGRRISLIVAFLLFAIAGASALVLPDVWSLLATRLILGCAGGMILTICLSLAGDFDEGGPRERLLGFAVAGASVVAALVLVGGGSLVDHLGWRAPFALYLLGFPAAALAWLSVRDARMPTAALSGLFKPMVRLWPLFGTVVTLSVAMFMPSIQGAFLMQSEGVSSAATLGIIAASCSVIAAISSASFGWIVRWMRPPQLLIAIAFVFGVGCLLMAFGHGFWAVTLGSAVMGVSAGLVEATSATLILSRVPVDMQSRALGLLLSAIFLGQFLNPWVVDPLRQALGIHGAFVAVGGGLIALAILLAVFRPKHGAIRTVARA